MTMFSIGEDSVPDFQPLRLNGFYDYSWVKVTALKSALEHHDWALWIDADSVFLDVTSSLEDLLRRNRDFVFTGDRNDLCNAGHLLFRKSDFSLKFIADWELLKDIRFPPMQTTMQAETGHIGDQVAINYLLGGGRAVPLQAQTEGPGVFNRVNGWPGNSHRKFAFFGTIFSPTASFRLPFTRSLIAPRLRPNVDVVVQHRLNAYPWWGKSIRGSRPGPIVHFVSGYKDLLPGFQEFVKSG